MAKSPYAYAEEEAFHATGEERQTLLIELSKYKGSVDHGQKTRHPNRVLRSVSPKLAKKALSKRYDDVFDELMQYFDSKGETFEDVVTAEGFKDVIIRDLADSYRQLGRRQSEPFADALINSANGKRWLEEHSILQVRKQQRKEIESFVFPRRREVFNQKIKGGAEVWRVVNEKTRTVEIVYKDFVFNKKRGRQQVVYRNINTGHFGSNPYKAREKIQLMKENF